MPKLYMLIGVPGSGKSTWIANQEWSKDCAVVSSDRYIDEEAKRLGKTYSDIFKDYVNIATRLMDNHVLVAQANGKDIIWDQTNTSAKTRRAKLAKLSDYEKIAVFFKTPEASELTKRLASRPGKNIPGEAMTNMINGLEFPTKEEGFSDIWVVG
jgi:predicted kinase